MRTSEQKVAETGGMIYSLNLLEHDFFLALVFPVSLSLSLSLTLSLSHTHTFSLSRYPSLSRSAGRLRQMGPLALSARGQ